MYEWKIRVAKSLKELEKIVEEIQSKGWTIEKIDVKSVSVVAYKAKKARPDLLIEQQEEGLHDPNQATDWDRGDYGQQHFC